MTQKQMDLKQLREKRGLIEKELMGKINEVPELSYKSRTPLFDLNGADVTSNDIILASLMAKMNVMLIGYQGKVKTELAKYVRDEWFNGNSAFIRGRKDITASSIFMDLKLKDMKTADTEKNLYNKNEKANNKLIIIDEFNRTPPIVQQETFGLSDGHFEKDGKIYYLGVPLNGQEDNRYVAVIGCANIGEAFKGVFEIDKALLDRYTILDTDLYPTDPTTYMNYMMHGADKNIGEANIQDLFVLYKDYYKYLMGDPQTGVLIATISEYLRSGLTYCVKDKTSKSNIEVKLRTGFCDGCHDKTRGCQHIPLTFERGVEFSNKMFIALDLITRAKIGMDTIDFQAISTGLAKTHAFRLGPIMKVSGLTNRIMVNDNTLNPTQITNNIAKFILDDVNSAQDKIEELLKQGNEIIDGDRSQINSELVNWFENGRWIHVYKGFMGMIE
jgi:hypothetical protein